MITLTIAQKIVATTAPVNNVELAAAPNIKFVLFYGATLFLMKREWSCSCQYDPYGVWVWKKRGWQNSVKFRNFCLIVRIEACGSRILHNVEVKTRSVKFRNRVSKTGLFGAF